MGSSIVASEDSCCCVLDNMVPLTLGVWLHVRPLLMAQCLENTSEQLCLVYGHMNPRYARLSPDESTTLLKRCAGQVQFN